MKNTKISRVLEHLKSGRSITPRQAIALYDYWRLSDAVFKLKARGYTITTTMHSTLSGCSFAEYKMEKS